MSPSLNGKQVDALQAVQLACTFLAKLASVRISSDCAATAATAILKYPLLDSLAVHVAPVPHTDSSKTGKSKASAAVGAAAAISASKAAAASLQKELTVSVAVAAVWAIVRAWFIW
jgi:hypothetical protein